MLEITPRPPRGSSLVACAVLALAAAAAPRSPAGLDEELGPEDLDARRKKLETWAHEPISLSSATFRMLVDRRDGSFVLTERTSGAALFSTLEHRGFAAVEMADGRILPADRLESLDVEGERMRWRAASTGGEIPPLSMEIAEDERTGGARISFEVESESRAAIRSVRLLDAALWTSDADGGGVAVPRGVGEWIAAGDPEDVDLNLEGPPWRLKAPESPDEHIPSASYSAPFFGVKRGELSLLVFWERRDVSLRIERRSVGDPRFPGRRGVFSSVIFPSGRGEVHLVASSLPIIGLLDVSRMYREIKTRDGALESLRSKAAGPPDLAALLGAVFFRPSLAGNPRPPLATGEARRTFEDVARLAEHMKEKLQIEAAAFILDDWIGSGQGEEHELWPAAVECGGAGALADCSRRVREAGYLFGLALDRDQLVRDRGASRPRGAEAWKAAEETARSAGGYEALEERFEPQMLLIREPPGEEAAEMDALEELLRARDGLARYTREVFGLWGSNIPGEPSVGSAGCWESAFTLRDAEGNRSPYPLLAGAYGQSVRLLLPRGEGLGPDDAEGFLWHLLIGEAPAYSLEEAPGAATGAGEPQRRPAADPQRACFSREGGWTRGMGLSARDIFIKNTSEVATAVSRIRLREPLVRHQLLTADRLVRESHFGLDMRIVVNLGSEPYEDAASGTVLPRFGFVVEYPFFMAFHALRAGGVDYDEPAFFTVRSLEGKMYLRAERTRIYHGFGPELIRLGGREFRVERESVIRIW
ncbi:MAG: hypothetical protein JXA90_02040 [Planctomycetes bacterium]|nr:hypothetical protein [Planctomycetota bacterium]